MIAFLTPGVSWTAPIYSVPLPLKSGVPFTASVSDAFLVFSLLMLMCECIKSARQGKSFVEHFLALLLAGGAAAEFWMVREGANSTFFLLVVICFVDLFAGFAASLRRARRSEEHTSELQSRQYLVCRLLLEKKKTTTAVRAPCRHATHLTRPQGHDELAPERPCAAIRAHRQARHHAG